MEAATDLGVSVDTIRRDLRALHDQGLLRRVHGGAVPASRLPQSFTERSQDAGAAHSKLAGAIVKRFRPGHVVGLDAGSTSVEIASLIPPTLAVTVVTNSPAVAVALSNHRATEVVLLGGYVDLNWMAAVGPETVDGWRSFRLDLGIVGSCGFDPVTGVTTNSHAEVATKRALIQSAAETIIAVQAEKFGTAAPYVIARVAEFDVVIVESLIDQDLLQSLRESGNEVVIAE